MIGLEGSDSESLLDFTQLHALCALRFSLALKVTIIIVEKYPLPSKFSIRLTMAASGTAQVPADSLPKASPVGDYVQEYEKILGISDEIFAGTHPRLKVPQQFVRKPNNLPRNPPKDSIPPAKVAKSDLSGTVPNEQSQPESASTAPATRQASPTADGPSAAATPTTAPGASASTRTVPKPTSEIDPIFLTKSDDLVRAEIQLQRQRVERTLRDQIEQKRHESRQRASFVDTKPDFDVSDVLNKAFEMVKPVGPEEVLKPNGTVAVPSESLDENSFYSSRAPDSPPPREPQRLSAESERHGRPSVSPDLAADVPVDQYSDELRRLEALNRSGSDQEMQDAYPVADQHLHNQRQARDVPVDSSTDKLHPAQPPLDAFEEPDYSPPAPNVPPMPRRDSREYFGGGSANGARRYAPDRGYQPRRSLSPGGDVRVIRNHITSPAAPRPSRVSPLANPAQQFTNSRQEYVRRGPVSGHTSPDVPAQLSIPRKRRRLHDERDRPVSYRRQAVDPPETYIKEEPVSPPPFADIPPAPRVRVPHERPVYIDIASPRYSPRYTPVADRREPSIKEPTYEADPYARLPEQEVHVEPAVPRALSRASNTRRPIRDYQDLRRVASLNQLRQPEIPREYVERPISRSMRAPSYAVVERPAQERMRYYDEPAPVYTRRYVPVDEQPFPPRYRETYVDEEPPAPVTAPPPPQRRIVIDEHGNQYYETMHAPRVQHISRPASRVAKSEIFDDRAPLRTASVRAASVVEDPYGERRYVQEMPPPQVTYRRVTDYGQPGVSDRRSYVAPIEQGEPFTRRGSVQLADYPARRSAYVDEPEAPRERLVRLPSVRPVPARYDDPRGVIQRVGSVRPGGREVSIFVDDDAQRPRDYIERPVYVTANRPMREDRYYGDGETGPYGS